MQLGEYESAAASFNEALKQNTAVSVEIQISLRLKLAECSHLRENIEEALDQVKSCRQLIEAELPRRVHAEPSSRQALLKAQETVLEKLADLSQSVYQADDDQMISSDMEKHLSTALECCERLFDLQRTRAESTPEGERLVSILQRILKLKLRLAPPAAKAVIRLAGRSIGNVDDKVMHDLVVRLVSGPGSPVAYMDKLLQKVVDADSMKDAEQDLKAIIQFTSSS